MAACKPDLATLRRIEALLREQLDELGESPDALEPHQIVGNMLCAVHPDGALSYSWRGSPLLDVEPETLPDGSVRWHFYTRTLPMQ